MTDDKPKIVELSKTHDTDERVAQAMWRRIGYRGQWLDRERDALMGIAKIALEEAANG